MAKTYRYQVCAMKSSFSLSDRLNGTAGVQTKLFGSPLRGIGVKFGATRDENGKEWVHILNLLTNGSHRLRIALEGWILRDSVDCPLKRIRRWRE